MPKTAPSDACPDRYDDWFDQHEAAYQSELSALRAAWPEAGDGLEIGVRTGRFAVPLGIKCGVDPSPEMQERASDRGIAVKDGVAEELPYPDERFDAVLMTTTLCYLDDPEAAFRGALRLLRPGGAFVLGFIHRDGPLGRQYEERKGENLFCAPARFHTARDVIRLLEATGFEDLRAWQTLFSDPEAMAEPDPVREGHGEGGFVVLPGVGRT
ncbi:SAM-dependent methyltransferase [Salinibacter ruber]|jgi:SAM-dependent methyltransferase|uniref:class I SAM-dependent methyltransferase n=1 Tax=Salinibacter ruber TaxID=146919 RepID=UPI002167CC63|nr:class I SAM-dependent methyltransferase [Salinibacter ruber]MCS3698633.1 SAM-dependent methyltransferase [Salinibacter ruber]MCS3708090.1 SAM-dependent methyltransferase [Salinibacter ruber]MCS3854738.1 SAM-dependent methyltransferase [Salinibacter ruber]MCS4198350.1 SAM-dependent methyltransferase [Salinibacter ruber]MCS4201545.1 SAM-dependent methyltransferase [Salinibacter ruber]